MSDKRVIKKYANRRLYDATASRHVTLDDLRKLIVSGEKIQVVDDKSGEDVTRATLLQIIAEQEQFATPVLSTELMETVIRFYGQNMALLSTMQSSVLSAFGMPKPDETPKGGPDSSDEKNKP